MPTDPMWCFEYYGEAAEYIDELEKQRDELLAAAKRSADSIAYAIYNLGDAKLEELPPEISETTCPIKTGLIAEKLLRDAIAKAEG